MPDAFSETGYRIEVNRNQTVQAQRWAVLHEMGHYFLHSDHNDVLADPMFLDRSGETLYFDKVEEREANQFAAVVLFGDGALRAAVGIYGKDIQRIAHHFGVSVRAVEIAMKQF